ncbi:kinase domain protein [Corynebacterium lipophiloflavum DSM 44291]|uniref:non-specific serine/threonine protein kinase n=1 Tax=Corynebacterium lipophiloflavum (strain ATCC 700352 / DSM 44291 / CCUG 37336 / JCM 10383 / DMMZ 1944) TaxID=525263 RepID=C0XRZ0_CORLD|nr:kinase domain protein [Corynebacterium lipophiloflavum DSM 44291]
MTELAVGDYLDNRYVIDRPIARGGMSTVYRCVDVRLGREVAAKVMDNRYVDDHLFLTRFRREARAMAQLSHPNLVNVYDFSHEGDHVFLIMELIRGGTLRELLAERGPMPPHAAAAVMRATLTGLSIAHRKGMVHRDIKPDNILINLDHRVKLADFGLVRAAADATHSTDQIVGTVSYLSPEQVDGSPMGPASDVYSAGIVLFELLTGGVPFSGETPLAHAYARLNRDVPAPSSRIEGVPKLVDELVATATSRRPEDRFVDAAEFLAALDDVAAALGLPDYVVPVPRDSAANRAAAHPTAVTLLNTPQPQPAPPAFERRLFPESGSTRVAGAAPQPPVTPVPAAPPPAAPSPVPVAPPPVAPPPKPLTNRSALGTAIFVALSLLVIALVAIGAWWFGSGMYGELPALIR